MLIDSLPQTLVCSLCLDHGMVEYRHKACWAFWCCPKFPEPRQKTLFYQRSRKEWSTKAETTYKVSLRFIYQPYHLAKVTSSCAVLVFWRTKKSAAIHKSTCPLQLLFSHVLTISSRISLLASFQWSDFGTPPQTKSPYLVQSAGPRALRWLKLVTLKRRKQILRLGTSKWHIPSAWPADCCI